jgi:hypothetical protein
MQVLCFFPSYHLFFLVWVFLSTAEGCWKKIGSSKSGTCLKLGIDRSIDSVQDAVPSLILTWKGDEPLDRLHICIKAAMISKSVVGVASPANKANRNSTKAIDNSIDSEEKMVGHCSISLEQLCKVALANAATSNATVAAPRILIHRGRPMHNLDSKTLQVRDFLKFYSVFRYHFEPFLLLREKS